MPLPSKSVTTFFVLAVLIIFGLLWLAYFYYTLSPVQLAQDAPAVEPLTIEKGDGITEIAAKLEMHGVVRSASMTKVYSVLSGKAHRLKPGLYTFSPASSTPQIISEIVAGPSREVSVLIKEGESVAEIDETLAHLGVIRRGELLNYQISDGLRAQYSFLKDAKSLEGFLFPDTYRFYFDSRIDAVVVAFLANFKAKIDGLFADTAQYDVIIVRLSVYNLKQILSIASMIEKEVPDSKERRLVSGIIYRRLKIGMALQIDATRDYAKLHGDEFDTYKNPGLPPAPIANPGLDAIDAALNPTNSNYLYYISDPKTKKTIFAETFEQHKANQLKYFR